MMTALMLTLEIYHLHSVYMGLNDPIFATLYQVKYHLWRGGEGV